MLFSSMTFVFLFLPAVCLLYALVKPQWRNYFLLGASIFFYAWGEPRYVVVMLLTIVVNYVGALLIGARPKYAKYFLAGAIVADLSFLVYFKYFNFIVKNINVWGGMDIAFLEVIMPIGISFYTFQAMSYLIDVYRGDCAVQKDFGKLALYITLFPQLVAGPIVKYHDVAEQINCRSVDYEKAAYGIRRFIVGLAKKMLLANTLGAVADRIFAQAPEYLGTGTCWLGAFFYSLQLYFDFSGYSDMAIGLGMIFGFRFLENFNYPYISKSITEFWRRWHISLSTWFKEYLYIPLGGNRIGRSRMYFNLFVVFLATGIWHGAEWTFVVWGLWHGFFIIFEKMTGWNREKDNRLVGAIQHIYTIAVFVIGWVLFRAADLDYAGKYIRNMLGALGNKNVAYDAGYYMDNVEIAAFFIGIVLSMPLFRNLVGWGAQCWPVRVAVNGWLLLLFVLSAAAIAASTYNPFIYFRF